MTKVHKQGFQLIGDEVMRRLTLCALSAVFVIGSSAVSAEGINTLPVHIADAEKAVSAPSSSKEEFYRKAREEMEPAVHIGSLLREKKFQEAKRAIENIPGADVWGRAVLHDDLARVPLYATDNKCKTGEVKYEGKEVEELLLALMKRYDVNDTFHGKFKYNSHTAAFLAQLGGYAKQSPACFDKPRLARLIATMLDQGLYTTSYGEEFSAGVQFSDVMTLGDVALAERILKGGIRTERKNWIYLFARAEKMEMVKLLEAHGYRLSKTDYQKIFELQKKWPDYFLKSADPEVIAYYKSKLN